jgi:tRNA dimethylallyltransferase
LILVPDKSKTVILITGATATGKTDLSLRIAHRFHTAIISADSRQCYREMNIGTAKPDADVLKDVRHYFVNSHAVTEELNAGIFEKLGLEYLQEIFQENEVAIVCGGTGLYIKALCEGMDEMPRIPAPVREHVRRFYSQYGIAGLQQELQLKDPEFFRAMEQQNPHRLMRALEVWEATGMSIGSFRKNKKKVRDFRIIKIGLQLSKEELWRNIVHRTDKMIRLGLAEEVKQLTTFRQLNALQTVGYTEMFDYLDGKSSLEEAVKNINLHTRQYAKRQMTWLMKDKEINWFPAGDHRHIMHFIQNGIAEFSRTHAPNT